MAEELKGLIEKIQKEGILAAEQKAKSIEADAEKQAKGIVDSAKKEAARIIDEAKEEIARQEKSSKAFLSQAARDMLLSLRNRMGLMLDNLLVGRIREALTPDETARIIAALIKEYCQHKKSDITVILRKDDLEKIKAALFSQLAEEVKKGVNLIPSEDVTGGFVISYDSGKSSFDFTDRALADYISAYLKPQLEEILSASADKT